MATAAIPPDGAAPGDKPAAVAKPTSRVGVISESIVQAAAQVMAGGAKEGAVVASKLGTFQKLGFAGVVCLICYTFQSDSITRSREDRLFIQEQARQDRVMFKDGLNVMHEDSNRKWQAINANQSVLVETAKVMQSLQQATAEIGRTLQAMQQTTAMLGEAVKELRTDLRRGGLTKPKPKPEPESRGGELLPLPKEAGG